MLCRRGLELGALRGLAVLELLLVGGLDRLDLGLVVCDGCLQLGRRLCALRLGLDGLRFGLLLVLGSEELELLFALVHRGLSLSPLLRDQGLEVLFVIANQLCNFGLVVYPEFPRLGSVILDDLFKLSRRLASTLLCFVSSLCVPFGGLSAVLRDNLVEVPLAVFCDSLRVVQVSISESICFGSVGFDQCLMFGLVGPAKRRQVLVKMSLAYLHQPFNEGPVLA